MISSHKIFLLLSAALLTFPSTSHAHDAQHNQVRITERDGYRYIVSNGIPDHEPGAFPNAGNPNRIREQDHEYRVTLHPAARAAQPKGPYLFGVALNGVPFDPGTDEFWRGDRQSGWRYDALSGKINLGMDQHHAHVQPDGMYHYHGIPTGFVQKLGGGQMKLVGYAADGFAIYVYPASAGSPKSSYRLKSGNRPGGPGGRYDGTFDEDYEYVAGAGDLDECNGMVGVTPEYPQGTYHYVLTDRYPFVPRFFRGSPDSSFLHRGMAGRGGPRQGAGGQGMPGGRRTPPAEAIDACSGSSDGESCSFTAPHGVIRGTCRQIGGDLACVPADGPPQR